MIARVAVWEPMPTDDRDPLADAVKDIPGVVAGFHLIDPETGNGLSVSIYEDAEAMAATGRAIARRVEELGWNNEPTQPPPQSPLRGHAPDHRPLSRSALYPLADDYRWRSASPGTPRGGTDDGR
jgi:hypothetical protein